VECPGALRRHLKETKARTPLLSPPTYYLQAQQGELSLGRPRTRTASRPPAGETVLASELLEDQGATGEAGVMAAPSQSGDNSISFSLFMEGVISELRAALLS
jgi:hypothetical protein